MQTNVPAIPLCCSGRQCIPNINHQEVLTLGEAIEARSRLTAGKHYLPLIMACG